MAGVEVRNLRKAFGSFIQSSENKTVPVGVLTELVRSDVYEWGSLMAGALIGSLPVAILYSSFCRALRLLDHRGGEGIGWSK